MAENSDRECPLSELPASQCACPKHRGGNLPDVDVMGPPFSAMHPGRCERCDRAITVGQTIIRVSGEQGYVHAARCPR